jgi:hypothetical protein
MRRRLRRRLFWAGVLLGLVLLCVLCSALRAGLWAWFRARALRRDRAIEAVGSWSGRPPRRSTTRLEGALR